MCVFECVFWVMKIMWFLLWTMVRKSLKNTNQTNGHTGLRARRETRLTGTTAVIPSDKNYAARLSHPKPTGPAQLLPKPLRAPLPPPSAFLPPAPRTSSQVWAPPLSAGPRAPDPPGTRHRWTLYSHWLYCIDELILALATLTATHCPLTQGVYFLPSHVL